MIRTAGGDFHLTVRRDEEVLALMPLRACREAVDRHLRDRQDIAAPGEDVGEMATRRAARWAGLLLGAAAVFTIAVRATAQPTAEEPHGSAASAAQDEAPSSDRDGDGFHDDIDECPDKPETRNQFEDDDGCPDLPHSAPRCQDSGACRERGLCALRGETCVAVTDAQCRASLLCAVGRCTARNDECVVASDDDCRMSRGCREKGRCTAENGRCVRHRSARTTYPPMTSGFFPLPQCANEDCRREGKCRLFGNQCIVGSSEDCQTSEACRVEGRCTAQHNECVATTTDACRMSTDCEEKERCYLNRDDSECYDGMRRQSTGAVVAGAVMTGIGGAAAVGGGLGALFTGLLLGTAERAGADVDYTTTEVFGAIAVAGVAVGLAGVPILVFGLKRVPDEKRMRIAQKPALEVRVRPTGGSLTWWF